jgi:hypothetical protein
MLAGSQGTNLSANTVAFTSGRCIRSFARMSRTKTCNEAASRSMPGRLSLTTRSTQLAR